MIRPPLWTWPELLQALSLENRGDSGPDVTGVSIDSRSLQPGDLFIALDGNPGERFHTSHVSRHDGHDFIHQAEAAGAAALLVHRPVQSRLPQLRVSDTLDALWDLARAARTRFSGPVYAVTGSSGKTTAKMFLSAALGLPLPQGSLNNFWGVPLCLARTPAGAPAAVFELGTSHPGEIGPLSTLVRPHIALLLNVLPAHLAAFQDLQALQREKLSIARGLQSQGILVLPGELADRETGGSTRTEFLSQPLQIPVPGQQLTFGGSDQDDVQLMDYDAARRMADLRCGDQRFQARVPGGGQHRAMTLAAVAACLMAAGKNVLELRNLTDALVPRGRGDLHSVGGIEIVDDSYNANPASLRAALDTLTAADRTSSTEAQSSRHFAILGDMLELGETSRAAHQTLAQACERLDGVFCIGAEMEALHEALIPRQRLGHLKQAADFDFSWLEQLRPGDRVLVKGSNRIFWAQDFVQDLLQHLKRLHEEKQEIKGN